MGRVLNECEVGGLGRERAEKAYPGGLKQHTYLLRSDVHYFWVEESHAAEGGGARGRGMW